MKSVEASSDRNKITIEVGTDLGYITMIFDQDAIDKIYTAISMDKPKKKKGKKK